MISTVNDLDEYQQLFIAGYRFPQVARQVRVRGEHMMVPEFTAEGDPIFALPGGGRGTEAEIRALIEANNHAD